MLYLGIDQHKRQLTVNLRNEDGSVILKRQVSHTSHTPGSVTHQGQTLTANSHTPGSDFNWRRKRCQEPLLTREWLLG
jgi:hypothetical protein